MKRHRIPQRGLMLLIPSVWLVTSASGGEVRHADDTTVYHAEGSKRVHVEGCRRLTSTEGMTKMTLAEAKGKGLPLCSRCPGTTTPRKTTPPNADADTPRDANAPTQDPILLWPADPKRNTSDGFGNMVKRDDGKTQVTDIDTPHLSRTWSRTLTRPGRRSSSAPGAGT